MPCDLLDFSSLTKDQTWAIDSENADCQEIPSNFQHNFFTSFPNSYEWDSNKSLSSPPPTLSTNCFFPEKK